MLQKGRSSEKKVHAQAKDSRSKKKTTLLGNGKESYWNQLVTKRYKNVFPYKLGVQWGYPLGEREALHGSCVVLFFFFSRGDPWHPTASISPLYHRRMCNGARESV